MMTRFAFCLLTVSVVVLGGSQLRACPFCSAVSQTFGEEIESMDVVVIARLVKAATIPSGDSDEEVAKSAFKITEVIKGQIKRDEQIEVLYFGEDNRERVFLVMGTGAPDLMWSTPLMLGERAQAYIKKVVTLAKEPSRLEFFQEHLEDEDEMLARDAYDEFAKMPYAGVIALKEKMHHDRLVKWINDPDIPASRRRLYLTMLGVCGVAEDTNMLADMMKSNDRKKKSGLDALIACYLLLKGEPGVGLVEELFLKNKDAEYADTYAAIMAIRFHGTEVEVISKSRLLAALRFMLDRPELADLVIPDLARWKDWSVISRLVQLFKEADDKSSWVRVPVINYLRACPLPEAAEEMDLLAKIDPDAVKRAKTFFPFTADGEKSQDVGGESGKSEKKSADVNRPETNVNGSADRIASDSDKTSLVSKSVSRAIASVEVTTTTFPTSDTKTALMPELESVSRSLSASTLDSEANMTGPNKLALLGVPLIVGAVLMATMSMILRVPRSINPGMSSRTAS